MNAEFTPLFKLTLSEKLQLLEDLWDSIALVPEQIPVLDWQKKLLEPTVPMLFVETRASLHYW